MPVVEMVTESLELHKLQVAPEEVQVEAEEQGQVVGKVKIQMYVMKEKILQYHIIQT